MTDLARRVARALAGPASSAPASRSSTAARSRAGSAATGTRANAITFTGGTNTLMLMPGFSVVGNAVGGPGNDTLAFGGTSNGAFNLNLIDTGGGTQQYQNFETFQVDGGTWTFSGATSVPFTVNGGTVMGNATFGGLTVNGGTVAPGNSIGTMTVNGDFRLGPGAVYEVEVNAAGKATR